MKNFNFDDIYRQLDDFDSGLYGIENDLEEMIESLNNRNRSTRKKFRLHDEYPEKRKRNRIRRKTDEFGLF